MPMPSETLTLTAREQQGSPAHHCDYGASSSSETQREGSWARSSRLRHAPRARYNRPLFSRSRPRDCPRSFRSSNPLSSPIRCHGHCRVTTHWARSCRPAPSPAATRLCRLADRASRCSWQYRWLSRTPTRMVWWFRRVSRIRVPSRKVGDKVFRSFRTIRRRKP
jgi:hypothetical protein